LEFWISKASQPCIGSSPTNMPLCQKSVRAMHAPMQESHNHAWSHVHAPQLMLDFMITEQGMCIFEKAPQRLLTLWLQSKACAFWEGPHSHANPGQILTIELTEYACTRSQCAWACLWWMIVW
jgi:hypothetical protein